MCKYFQFANILFTCKLFYEFVDKSILGVTDRTFNEDNKIFYMNDL